MFPGGGDPSLLIVGLYPGNGSQLIIPPPWPKRLFSPFLFGSVPSVFYTFFTWFYYLTLPMLHFWENYNPLISFPRWAPPRLRARPRFGIIFRAPPKAPSQFGMVRPPSSLSQVKLFLRVFFFPRRAGHTFLLGPPTFSPAMLVFRPLHLPPPVPPPSVFWPSLGSPRVSFTL